MQRGSKFWIGATAGLIVAQMVATALLPRGSALSAAGDVLFALLITSLVLAFANNAIRSEGRVRAFWVLQAAGWSFWLADSSLWTLYDVILRKPLPAMFAGDVFLFLAGVPMLAGLLLRPHLEPSRRSVRLGMLDFLLLMLWWVYVYVYLVMCWQYVSENGALYSRNYDRLYLLAVVVLVGVVGLQIKRSAGAWRRFYSYFLLAVLFNYLMFQMENRAIEMNVYYNGSWFDTPFMISFAVFMFVAMKGRGLMPSPETVQDEKYGSWMASLAVVAVLSLPVIAVTAVLDGSVPPQIMRFRVLITAVTMFAMAGLVFVKQRWLHQELKRANEVYEEASLTDPLTGVRNRRFFAATIQGDIAQALRAYAEGRDRSIRDLIFYLVDIDNFKEVNDLHGHDAGDRVLVEIARRIGSAIRNSDVLVRWGGEEFLVVSRSTDRREADTLALRVMDAVRGTPLAVGPGCEMRRTCSIGWAPYPWSEQDVEAMTYEEVLNLADRGLCHAKKSGKNQVIGMTPNTQAANSPANARFNPKQPLVGALHQFKSVDLEPSRRS